MAWKFTRIAECTTVAVVVVLVASNVWTHWGDTDDDITGSIPRAPVQRVATTKLPPVISAAASVPAAPARASQMNLVAHIIEPRETMKSIAARFNTRTAEIAAINRITVDTKLRPGEILVVPSYR